MRFHCHLLQVWKVNVKNVIGVLSLLLFMLVLPMPVTAVTLNQNAVVRASDGHLYEIQYTNPLSPEYFWINSLDEVTPSRDVVAELYTAAGMLNAPPLTFPEDLESYVDSIYYDKVETILLHKCLGIIASASFTLIGAKLTDGASIADDITEILEIASLLGELGKSSQEATLLLKAYFVCTVFARRAKGYEQNFNDHWSFVDRGNQTSIDNIKKAYTALCKQNKYRWLTLNTVQDHLFLPSPGEGLVAFFFGLVPYAGDFALLSSTVMDAIEMAKLEDLLESAETDISNKAAAKLDEKFNGDTKADVISTLESEGFFERKPPMTVGSINDIELMVGDTPRLRDVTSKFSDPNGDELDHGLQQTDENVADVRWTLFRPDGELEFRSFLEIRPKNPGTTMVTITATDPNGLSASLTFTVIVTGQEPPEAVGAIDPIELTPGGSATTIDVEQNFSSENSLTYKAKPYPSDIVTTSESGSVITIDPVAAGVATVVVTARDTENTDLTAIQTISVSVRQTSAVIFRPTNTDPTWNPPSGSNPRAEGLREGVSVIVDGLAPGNNLSVRAGAGTNYNRLGIVGNGDYGIITDGPRHANGFTWWEIDWDTERLDGWSAEVVGGIQLLFRRPPDLEIRDLEVDDSQVGIGEEIELEVEIHNNGPGESASTDVYFYYHSGSRNDDLEELVSETDLRSAGKLSVPSLQERRGTTLTLTVDAPPTPDRYYYGAFLPSNVHNTDYQGDLEPDMLRNNLASEERVRVVGSPDYIVESIRLLRNRTTLDPGESFTLKATVRNIGNGAPTSHPTLDYYRSRDARISTRDRWVKDDRVSKLDTDETDDIYTDDLTAPTTPGVYYYGACVSDVDNESDEDNNCSAAVAITVRATTTPVEVTGSPDLVVSLSSNSSLVEPNEYIDLVATVQNQGAADASNSTTLRYYLSSDATISSDDQLIATDSVRSLDQGSSGDEDHGVRAPSQPGQYYYYAYVDSVTDEDDTNNNYSNFLLISVRGADLVVESVSADLLGQTGSINPNGTFTLNATIRNQGTGTAAATTARYYISTDQTFSDVDDSEVQPASISAINTGASSNAQSATIRSPYTSGIFYCFVCVDTLSNEIDADNNCSNPIQITIRNVAPRAKGTIAAQTLNVGTSKSLNISDDFVDDNRDTLTYSVSSSNINIATASVSGAQVTITPKNAGSATITVTASDDTLTGTQTFSVSITATISEADWMPDANLRAAVRSAIGLQQSESLTQKALEELTTLNSDQRNIQNLIGLEHATELTHLNLGRNQISDITPIAKLTKLTNLDLKYNQVRNTTSLQNLTKLTWLDLHQNGSSNITPLQGLTELTHLDLGRNGITDITSLQSLTKLTYLDLSFNGISNITPLQNLTALTSLNLWYTQKIVDITPLQGLTALTFLHLGTNKIVDIEPLKNLISLTNLNLTDNQIKDVMPLEKLTALRFLYLKYNPIDDFTPLRSLKTKNPDLSIDIDIPEVTNNTLTKVGTISARTLTVGDSAIVLDVSGNFQDPDNDTLTYTANSNNANVANVSVSGSQVTITPVSAGSAKITVTANDGELTASQTISVTVTAAPVANRAPVTVGAISARTLTVGDSAVVIDVSGNFNDPDDDDLTYSANSSNTSVATTSVSGSIVTITPVSAGNATITVTASDDESTATQTISVTVTAAPVANRAPVTVGAISARTLTVGDSAIVIDVSSNFQDPDNDTLTYSVNSNNTNVVNVSVSGSQVTITPVSAGNATITVTASDGELTAPQTIAISVTNVPVANQPPVPVSTIPAQHFTTDDDAKTLPMELYFNDPENNALTYTATSNNTTVATASITGNQLTITPVNAGSATITVEASDSEFTATQLISVSVTTSIAEAAWMPDANLRAAVHATLGLQSGVALTQDAMTGLTRLNASNSQISDLTGLEHATNLRQLYLSGNQISDISALQNLTTLTTLVIENNQVSDVTPLNQLTALTNLDVSHNQISDIGAFQNLTALTSLDLTTNQINDVTPLQNLSTLTSIYLGTNQINSIISLGSLTALTFLSLNRNSISDISSLADLTNLGHLSIGYNQISNITPIQSMTQLTALYFNDNQISDITPLQSLTNLTNLGLQRNQISDVTSLESLISLRTLSLIGNPISDLSPLSRLKLQNPNVAIDITSIPEIENTVVAVGTIPPQTLTTGSTTRSINVAQYFNVSPDSIVLTYDATSDNTAVATVSVSGSVVTITQVAAGSAIVTVEANHDTLTATQRISVSVITDVTEETWMPDTILRSAVRSALSLQEDDDLTQQAMESLTRLVAQQKQIGDLTGLEYAANLKTLYLWDNQISDLSPLEDLTALTQLNLSDNQISDISSLEDLTALTWLVVSDNKISDLTPLEDLTALTTLSVDGNEISNISSLAGLTALNNLSLTGNQISSITPLEDMSALTHLHINETGISDISPLEDLTTLTQLNAWGNSISDISPLEDLTALTTLRFRNNQISDLSPLEDLTALTHLDLENNQISDVSPLENLTALTRLYLSGNSITDYGPLRRLKVANPNVNIDITIPSEPTPNRAPVAVGTITAQTLTVGGSSVTVDASDNFSDADNDTLTYTANSGDTGVATVSVSGAVVTITPVAAGSATITVTASDSALTATQTISVTVSAGQVTNQAPTAVGTISDQSVTVGGSAATVDVSSKFNDPDNDNLTYTASSSDTSIATVSVSGAVVTITPVAAGSATITVTASDSALTATQTISVTVNAGVSEETWMPDANLRRMVRDRLGIQQGEALTLDAMATLTRLFVSRGIGINDLTGLEHATNLNDLSLYNNRIGDLTPLQNLTALTSIHLDKNQVTDITPLQNLTTLTSLDIAVNQISDITPLQNLTALTNLGFANNQVSNLTPLQNLTALTNISFYNNQINDITPFQNLTALTNLDLRQNQISDVSVLEDLTSLTSLELSENPIADYAPLSKLKEVNTNVNIDINLNNNIPVFTEGDSTTRSVAENTASGVNIGSTVSATDTDNHTLTYSLSGTDASSFSIVSSSGQLQTSAALDYETETSYSVTVSVYDGNSGGDSITVTINVTDDVNNAPSAQATPTETVLLPNYPNPFNPETWIPYQLAKSADVALTFYNVQGVVVRQLSLGHRVAGVYYSRSRAAHWDGKNNLGEKVAAGLYFVKFKAGNYTSIRKMLIRK